MIPDIKIKDYYLQFIYNAKKDIVHYKKHLDLVIKTKEELYKFIEEHKNIIKDSFNISLDEIKTEWVNKEYNSKEYLYNIVIVLLRNAIDHPNRICILQLIKYCNILRNEYRYKKLIELANKRKDIKFGTYKKYISSYYNKVHKCVLQGLGYKFTSGIGTYIINYWKLDTTISKNKYHLNYAATNAKKKELISKGLKPYDEKEAIWYKTRNIPYDGIEYRVFEENTDYYEFAFLNSRLTKSQLEYQRTEYVATKYRGMSYTKMADELCKTEEDIYNLQVDIRYKLNIFLYKNPTKYLNYVRTN